TTAQPAAAALAPAVSSTRSDSRPAAWPRKRPAAIEAPNTPGPRPLTAGSASSCRSRKIALQFSIAPSTTNAAAPINPITSSARSSRARRAVPRIGGSGCRPSTTAVSAISTPTATRIGSRPEPALRASPAVTAPASTPVEYSPCASGISRRSDSRSMRAACALMPTSSTPDAAPVSTSAPASTGSEVARPGRAAAPANAAHAHATARPPKRSTAGPAIRIMAGTEPTATNSSATPSAPFDAPTPRCTSGRTAAQAPQNRPSATKPVSVRALEVKRAFRQTGRAPGLVELDVLEPGGPRRRREHPVERRPYRSLVDDAGRRREQELLLVLQLPATVGECEQVELPVEGVPADCRSRERLLEVHVPRRMPAVRVEEDERRPRVAWAGDPDRPVLPVPRCERPVVGRDAQAPPRPVDRQARLGARAGREHDSVRALVEQRPRAGEPDASAPHLAQRDRH